MPPETTSPPVGLRPAVETDADQIRDLVVAAYEHYIERMGKPPGPMLDDYRRVIREHRVRVAVEEARIIGVLVLIDQPDVILLDNVAVSPAYQGRGLGRRLIAAAEDECRELGHRAIDLYTHELMTENIALYTRLGYREVARREVRGYRRVYMRKELTS